ncbi:MAG: hypothetical protein AAF943_07400 [Pseudomonadota bacterium]
MKHFRDTCEAQWEAATGLAPITLDNGQTPQGMLLAEPGEKRDRIAVVYDHAEKPPEITVQDISNTVRTVLANGVAVAIVACATGPALTPDDVLLVAQYR